MQPARGGTSGAGAALASTYSQGGQAPVPKNDGGDCLPPRDTWTRSIRPGTLHRHAAGSVSALCTLRLHLCGDCHDVRVRSNTLHHWKGQVVSAACPSFIQLVANPIIPTAEATFFSIGGFEKGGTLRVSPLVYLKMKRGRCPRKGTAAFFFLARLQ